MRVFTINFHRVSSQALDSDAYTLSEDQFAVAMGAIHGVEEARVTLDDGYASDLDIALPFLQQQGLTAIFFVCVSLIGKAGYLSGSGIAELLAAGMTIGSHGSQHRPWRRLSPSDEFEEIAGAKDCLEQLIGRPVTQAACPFGAYDRRSLGALRRAGFTRVYTSDGGWISEDRWLQPRNTLKSPDAVDTVRRLLGDRDKVTARGILRQAKMAVKSWR